MLVGLIYLYLHTPGQHSFDIQALYTAGKSLSATCTVYLILVFLPRFWH